MPDVPEATYLFSGSGQPLDGTVVQIEDKASDVLAHIRKLTAQVPFASQAEERREFPRVSKDALKDVILEAEVVDDTVRIKTSSSDVGVYLGYVVNARSVLGISLLTAEQLLALGDHYAECLLVSRPVTCDEHRDARQAIMFLLRATESDLSTRQLGDVADKLFYLIDDLQDCSEFQKALEVLSGAGTDHEVAETYLVFSRSNVPRNDEIRKEARRASLERYLKYLADHHDNLGSKRLVLSSIERTRELWRDGGFNDPHPLPASLYPIPDSLYSIPDSLFFIPDHLYPISRSTIQPLLTFEGSIMFDDDQDDYSLKCDS